MTATFTKERNCIFL